MASQLSMRRIECEVATIGAGVAGLAATSILKGAGKHVLCVEATGRVGGRVLTLHDPLTPVPIELGAEFVHGLPPETWRLIYQAGMTAYEHTPKALHIDRGRVLKEKQVSCHLQVPDCLLGRRAEIQGRWVLDFQGQRVLYVVDNASNMSPLLTGWTAGSAAIQFQGMDKSQIAIRALASLARILRRKIPKPEAVYFHNWQADPFFRGAYSYVPAGHLAARKALAQPVDGTLYFAGEAADLKGHSGTVHGAIASGSRAAELVVASQG